MARQRLAELGSGFSLSAKAAPLFSLVGEEKKTLSYTLPSMRRPRGRIVGFGNPVSFEGEAGLSPMTAASGYAEFTVTTIDPWPPEAQNPVAHGAILIWLGGEDYLFAGQGATLTVEPADGQGRIGFDRVEEGRYEGGQWIPGRRLNGDQTHQGRHVRLPPGEFGVQRFRLYRY